MARDASKILSKDAGGIIMTTAEILEKRGEKRGEKLGVLKVALNMFKLGLDEDTIFLINWPLSRRYQTAQARTWLHLI